MLCQHTSILKPLPPVQLQYLLHVPCTHMGCTLAQSQAGNDGVRQRVLLMVSRRSLQENGTNGTHAHTFLCLHA